jgi:AcrR family transcriptional regulator
MATTPTSVPDTATDQAPRHSRKRGLTHVDVVAAGLAVVDGAGVDGLSLVAVAAHLDVRSPSLYAHVDGLAGLRRDLAHAATVEFGEVLRDAVLGRSDEAAVRSFAEADPERWLVVDGSGAVDEVAQRLQAAVSARLA